MALRYDFRQQCVQLPLGACAVSSGRDIRLFYIADGDISSSFFSRESCGFNCEVPLSKI